MEYTRRPLDQTECTHKGKFEIPPFLLNPECHEYNQSHIPHHDLLIQQRLQSPEDT